MSDEPKNAPSESEALEQSENDTKVAGSDAEPAIAVYRSNGEHFESPEEVSVDAYDFRNPVLLTEAELRPVKIRHEQFIHCVAARLSLFLRMDFLLKMGQLFTIPYRKFVESIPNPSYISMFQVEQLSGVGVFALTPRLAMTMIDRILGGEGQTVKDERYLTEIEITLIEDVINIVLEEWCRQWEDVLELNAIITGSENSGRFLQTSPQDSIVLVITMECNFGDFSEQVQLALPYNMIEPVIKKLQEKERRDTGYREKKDDAQWRDAYADVDIPVFADWEAFELTLRDLVNLRPGDVLELPREIIEQTRISLMDTPRFVGEIGLEGQYTAVKVTEVIENQ